MEQETVGSETVSEVDARNAVLAAQSKKVADVPAVTGVRRTEPSMPGAPGSLGDQISEPGRIQEDSVNLGGASRPRGLAAGLESADIAPSERIAALGDIVLMLNHLGPNRDRVPAMVTRVNPDGTVNLRVFYDNSVGAEPHITSARFDSSAGALEKTWIFKP